ncbi:MAG: hydrolase [Bacteroidetes bacterium]|nr:MAG: hydrolase [Bacteroidota bacterium]
MFRIFLLINSVILLFFNTILISQTKGINRDKYRINITKTDKDINIDGILDEPVWLTADKANHFRRVLPTDTGFAIAQTEVKVIYDESNIYVGIVCFDPTSGKRPVESLRRDFNFMKNDNFIVFIDTYNDQTNGFAFGISAAGAQWDGVQANGGLVNLDWDIKWRSAVKNYDDRWVAEFAIPFRSIRYHGGANEWGINFSRHDLKTSEKSSWAPMPRQFATATLAFTGSLVWDKPLPSSGPRFSLIPYISAKTTQNKEAGEGYKPVANAGIDAKIILSTSMNLDLTVNPDYSQVEVDKQQTNLDRFELFFPEKRQFYLENSDLFANLGSDNLRPFFSRRIGLNSSVQAGARLSGKIGNNWRIGLMDLQTGEKDNIPAANFTVAALQRKVFRRSNISAFLVNKQVTNLQNDTSFTGFRYNRVAGVEFNLASANNRWTGKTFYHQSFYPGASGNASAMAANIIFSTQYFTATLNQSWVGADYLAEVGYIRRKGYYEINPMFLFKFFPASSQIANHGPAFKLDMLFDPSQASTDRDAQLLYQVEWINRSILQVDVKNTYIKLQSPFDPTNSAGIPLAANEEFNWKEAGASFVSDIRKPFNFLVSSRYGGYFNGIRFTMNGELYYRIQPYGSLGIVTTFNKISLPSPYNSAEFVLIGPRLDFTFTNNLFFTSFVQYNNQIDNINLNLRFQWRFAPVSDLFIVYTENSFPGDYRIKNRGLVLKISYWFN